MAPRNFLWNRIAAQLTALVMAHGLSSHARAQSTNQPPISAGSTNAPTQLPEVVVKGAKEPQSPYKPETVSSSKYSEPLRDTPQSITVVPRQLLDDQNATTLRDALRNVAGISLAAGEGGAQGDNLTLRGFTARNDIFLDGMRDFGSYYRDPFNWDKIEVLKGPSSVMFGRGSTGGIINQSSKTPLLDSFVAGSFTAGTDHTFRATADINEPVPELGSGTALRLNLMGNNSEVASRDVAENRRFGVAPSLSLGLGTDTRATFSFYHQSEDDIPDYGIPWLFNKPAPVPREKYYGFEDTNFLKTAADIGTVKLEHDFSEHLTLRDQFRYANYQRDAQITEAKIAGTPTPATPLSAIQITRNQIAVSSVETFLQNQIDLIGKFDTGPIEHTLVGGIEAGRETSDPTRFAFTGVPGTSLENPDENQSFAGTSTASSKVNTTATSVGLYAVDTLKLGDHWEVAGGLRWDHFDSSYTQSVAPGGNFNRVDDKPSWRGALVYKPIHNGSIYFDYGTSFNPSAETLALTAASQNVEPEENETFELGTKWDFLSERLSLRGAVFRTDKTNARETDPNNPLLTVLSGEQRVDGVEIEIAGKITPEWQVFGNYAYLRSKLVSSKFFPAAVGSQLANVPEHTFSLWTTYSFPWQLEIGGGGRYVGSRTASSTVPLDPVTGLVKKAPGYWAFDAMIKYHVTKNIDVQLNIYNLADKYYYDQLHPAHIVPGAGRTATLSTNFKF